ncbi:methyltransferase domain-containing protein [Halobacillus litoralis]|uniref:Methyltransferase domain-containing protein n=1 Tax=Halobacillus litoralis TaxID=45668 RepID=A0A845E6N2_9BACI|nr:methyltransferase domain-containing protein [Halobacillus litoralis]MYL21817.1 methyltransferase domain-containing protein [Halobacillus litoralis]
MKNEQKQRVQETFSKNKEAYVQSSTHNNPDDLKLLIEWLNPEKHWRVLDAATGGGHVAKAVQPFVNRVYATDLTKEMLQNTAAHLSDMANIVFVVADAEELPFLDGYFDAVTCRIAPHHFPEPATFVSEVSRVLKPGGRFLMIDNTAPEDDQLDQFYNAFEKRRDPSHVRALKVSEWEALFYGHSLVVKKHLKRQKTLPFSSWVARTQSCPVEQHAIEQDLLSADTHTRAYFSITSSDSGVEHFSIDEYMVLLEKGSC